MPEAMTLNEYAKGQDDLTRSFTELFSDSSDVLEAFPWESIDGGVYKYVLEDTLGGIAFRGINETFTPDIGVENPQVESLYTAGGEVDIDSFLLRTQGESRKAREEVKKVKKMARAVTDKIIYGDNTTEPREFDGLQRRLTGTQLIANNSGSGGGALSLQKLDEAISQTVEPTHIIAPKKFRDVHFPALMRNQNIMGNAHIETSRTDGDAGRRVMKYNDLPLLVGYETGPDSALLPFTETGAGGGAAQCTSLYVVSLKQGHLWGIQSGEIIVDDLGKLQSKPADRTRVEWDPGMVIENRYAATRLSSVTDAAIVA